MEKKQNLSREDSGLSRKYLKNLTKKSSSGAKETNLWNAQDAVSFAEKKIGIKLDEWQKKYIKTKGNVAIRAGRQSGKSFAQSLRVALFALLNEKTQTLIIGAVDRQSVELFEKVKSHITILAKHQIKGRPTMHKIELKNSSRIIAQPAGRTGYGLRGYTINKLVVDEAHYVPEEVWVAIRPMMATIKNSSMDILSTPRGNVGFFYDAFETIGTKEDFTQIHVKSEDCPRITKEFLAQERKRMTKLQYMQEYEAVFLDALQQFFPLELIDSVSLPKSLEPVNHTSSGERDYYLGVDVARYGGDQNAFVITEIRNEKLLVKQPETTEKVSAADTISRIKELEEEWDFRKIYIDDGGVGGPILDFLLEEPEIKRKVIGINNASRPVVADKSKGKKILKEDLYGNLKTLMEQKLITLPYDLELRRSLLSIQFEYNEETGRVKIHGRYTHITEALIRAAWCMKSKGLKIWVDWT